MDKFVNQQDNVINQVSFLKLGYKMPDDIGDDVLSGPELERNFDVDNALRILEADPDFGVRFLSQVERSGEIYFVFPTGDTAEGVRIRHGRNGDVVTGSNEFGKFLEKVKDLYLKRLANGLADERPVSPDQVVSDFGNMRNVLSVIGEMEEDGERFIHVDSYRPKRFRFDANRDGTTGHAQRDTDEDVRFHSFVCPFGTSPRSTIVVGSAAEVSILYEQALRGELDWNALITSLKDRGLMDSKMTKRQQENLVSDCKAQFEWMREQICSDPSLRNMRIVAPSLIVPDSSMGRSVYDPVFAPSPAHVLARYINNPSLFYTKDTNGVMRSLGIQDKNEPELFQLGVSSDSEFINILVLGSDTIGGRRPGQKATLENTFKKSEKENFVYATKEFKVPLKDREEQMAEYARLKERLDAIIPQLMQSSDKKIRLVVGNVSSKGQNPGVGTPQMVKRYVQEKGGSVCEYNFAPKDAGGNFITITSEPSKKFEDPDKSVPLFVLMMPYLVEAMPVLAGMEEDVAFPDAMTGANLTFSGLDEGVSGAICFSDTKDMHVSNVYEFGSLCVSGGLPVIHVQNLQSQREQEEALASGAEISRAGSGIDVMELTNLFQGDLKDQWDVNGDVNLLSSKSELLGGAKVIYEPVVAESYPKPVHVGNRSYNTLLGVYAALVAQELGLDEKEMLNDMSKSESSPAALLSACRGLLSGKDAGAVSPDAQERLLRQAIRKMSEANIGFYDFLLNMDKRDVVMQVSGENNYQNLFVDENGKGENRFGLAMAAERDALQRMVRARMEADEQERLRLLEEADRREKAVNGARAQVEFVKGGLPRGPEEAKNAAWMMFTNEPLGIALKGGDVSFDIWDDRQGTDKLNREKAARQMIYDGDEVVGPNKYLYLFPCDLGSVTGRTAVRNYPSNWNLTGVERKDERTGEMYPAAIGIPLWYDNKGNESVNPTGARCSYMLDNDSSKVLAWLVRQDGQARKTAVNHDLAFCVPGREYNNGTASYALDLVFLDRRRDPKTGKSVKNPHSAPNNASIVDSYIKLLERGKYYPLNCIALPRQRYYTQDSAEVRQKVDAGERFISAEGRYVADLLMALKIANAYAVLNGVPVRIPLDEKGNIDLGPGVPEEFRLLTQKRIESFFNVTKKEDVVDNLETLPYIEVISGYEASKSRNLLVKDKDLNMRPNDLVAAFGKFDFKDLINHSTYSSNFGMRESFKWKDQEFKSIEQADVYAMTYFSTASDYTLETLRKRILASSRKSELDAIAESIPGFRKTDWKTVGQDYRSEIRRAAQMHKFVGVPLHEMNFRMEDGTVFTLKDASNSYSQPQSVINDYILYNRNDVRRFLVKTTDTSKTPLFFAALKAYAERAKAVKVEARLVPEKEMSAYLESLRQKAEREETRGVYDGEYIYLYEKMRDASLQGYVNLLPSNSDQYAESVHDIGREASFLNAEKTALAGGRQKPFIVNDKEYRSVRNALGSESLRREFPIRWKDEEFATEAQALVYAKLLCSNAPVAEREAFKNRLFTADDREVLMMRDQVPGVVGEKWSVLEPVYRKEVKDAVLKRERVFRDTVTRAAADRFEVTETATSSRDVDGNDVQNEYYGRVEANDGFKGYVQLRYTLPDGTSSDWQTVTDLDLAKDTVMSMVKRTYRSDNYVVPSDKVMNLLWTAEAVRMAGEQFRNLKWVSGEKVEADDRVVEISRTEDAAEKRNLENFVPMAAPQADYGRLFVTYWGSSSIPEDAILVQISTPKSPKYDVDVTFKSLFPDNDMMVKPLHDGLIDESEYTKRYREKVLGGNRDKIFDGVDELIRMAKEERKDVYFIASEEPGEFSHRYLFSNFLNENGIPCYENPEDRKLYEQGHVRLVNDAVPEVSAEKEVPVIPIAEQAEPIQFVESSGGYQQRTRENAQSDDIDLTLAFATDFSTFGERATAKAAGDYIVQVELPTIANNGGIDCSPKAVDACVNTILSRLPEDFLHGEQCAFNIAGNGLSTLSRQGGTQEQANAFMTLVLKGLKDNGVDIRFTRSGGQTGMDTAGNIASAALGIPTLVNAPKNWGFRTAFGKDIWSEQEFKARFSSAMIAACKRLVAPQEQLVPVKGRGI